MGLPFIDWVHLFQRHSTHRVDGGLVIESPYPVVASGVRVLDDWMSDKDMLESFQRLRHVGSHETSVGVLCDGSSVDVSGNVGRVGRPDNVFNLDWPDTLDAANAILACYALPPFHVGEYMLKSSVSERDHERGLISEYTGE